MQGDLGPFNPGLPVQVPLWLAVNLEAETEVSAAPAQWMDVGEDARGAREWLGGRVPFWGVCTSGS